VKPYIPIIITVAAVVILLGATLLITPKLQPPQNRLNQQIDDKVEMAKRMLAGYKPTGMQMSMQLTATATQPENIPLDQWQQNLNYVKQESPFADPLQKMQREMNRLDQMISKLDNDTQPPAPPANAREGYIQLNQQLQDNQKSIADALNIVRQAVKMNVQTKEQTISGSTHPVATRMEAILSHTQANLLRRRAALYHALADQDRARFVRVLSAWRHTNSNVRSLESNLISTPAGPIEPQTKQDAENKTKSKAKTKSKSLFTKTIRKLLKKNTGQETLPKTNTQPEPDVKEQPVQPSNIPHEKLPNLQERIDSLKTKRKKVVADIGDAKTNVDKLSKIIENLEKQIAKAKAQANQAEKQMMALSSAGIDPADPNSLDRFIAEYNAAAKSNRDAAREANILEKGSVRNAHTDRDNQNKKPSDKLVPIDPNKKITHVRGLVAFQSDLRINQGMIETNTALLSELDKQIEELSTRQEEIKKRLNTIKTSRRELRKKAETLLKSAIAAVVRADILETEALQLAGVDGMQAAVRAQEAAKKRSNEARTNQDPEKMDEPLDMITKDRFTVGHVQTLQADLQHIVALINAQRVTGLKHHQWMLERTERMGIKIGQDLLPEDLTPDNITKAIIQSNQAAQAVKQAQDLALQAAEKALEMYNLADDDLKQLWVLHTNIASVHYLMAGLTSGEQAKKHREFALREYQRSIQNRTDQPEAKMYKHIIDGLTKAQQ
jgi:archaellum component FlaC